MGQRGRNFLQRHGQSERTGVERGDWHGRPYRSVWVLYER